MRAFLFFLSVAAYAGPCITSNTACTEWVSLGGGPSRSLIYRTYPLQAKNDGIVRALIMVHGAGRDADNYFRSAVAAAFLADALDDTIVIAPRFASNDSRGCHDTLAPNEVSWSCNGDSWRSGGTSLSNDHLTSYDLADDILRKLARKDVFPNLKAIVVAGHSAGGQFVTRYEMANKVHDTLGVPVSYIVSNPSSYAYPDANRPAADGKEFRAFGDSRNCTTYDRWPYGLQNRGGGYAAQIPDDALKKQLAARPTVYLLGEIDILPLGGFDSSCPAMAQGPTRLARGQAFGAYVNQKYGAQHKVTVVPLCGHNARCMFTAEPALPILFPK
ncbi:MAG TPA: alpha/beta fold hydrolase [Bryobacteraceae bacterium]|nr:alpha/beta fold hydrolase [Bryobacteraceae bacterium]